VPQVTLGAKAPRALFPALLARLGASLVVTTYEVNKLHAVRAGGNVPSALVRTFNRSMGRTGL